jgi:hypothetical protein
MATAAAATTTTTMATATATATATAGQGDIRCKHGNRGHGEQGYDRFPQHDRTP